MLQRKVLILSTTDAIDLGLHSPSKRLNTQLFNNAELAKKPSLCNIQGYTIENVLVFTYHGHVVTTDENPCFKEHRISSATSKFNELKEIINGYQHTYAYKEKDTRNMC